MARLLAVLFFAFAALRAFFDWQIAGLNETAFAFLPIGQVWFNFDRGTLLGLQPGIERYLSPVIWENAVGPMLLWPMAPTLFGVGVFCAAIAIWRAVRKAMA
ncbi:MAG: hypothetical protein COB08_000575 [Rhodobacteraceae bacterium]|nr:hypothetical protein [Paracoccaceae bacterium]